MSDTERGGEREIERDGGGEEEPDRSPALEARFAIVASVFRLGMQQPVSFDSLAMRRATVVYC